MAGKKPPKPKVQKSAVSDFTEMHKEWFDESPRGIILTAGAYMDDRLGEIIKAFLIDNEGAFKLMDGFNAPLGSFSSRIAAAFAFGLISSKEYEMLEIFREIRNKYAHEIKIRVTDAPVANLAKKFIKRALDESWEPGVGREEEDYLLNLRVCAFEFLLSFVTKTQLAGGKRLNQIEWASIEGD